MLEELLSRRKKQCVIHDEDIDQYGNFYDLA